MWFEPWKIHVKNIVSMMAQEDDKKQNPTVQHYVVCKTQQKNIMFFCKLQQKNIAKPNR